MKMSILALFSKLNRSGIRLRLAEDNLKINAPKGKLTPGVIKELRDRKNEIIEFLKSHVQDQEIYISIKPAEKREYYVLSSAQRRLYILQQMEAGNMSYNMPATVVLEGKLDKDKVDQTFKKLIARHQTLRTSFQFIGGQPVQRIHDNRDIEFKIEYHETGEEERKIIEKFVRPFNLSQPPLLRLGLVKIEKDRYILMFDMHHIITDGTSMSLFLREFMTGYHGEEGRSLMLQFSDFATWQYRRLAAGDLKKQERYWDEQFPDELPALNLHTDYPRPAVQSFEGDRFDFLLEESLSYRINSLIDETGTTLFIMLLAVFNIILSKYTGQEDIVTGSTIAGRSRADLQDIIGLFIEDLALRNYPVGDLTFVEFLHQVKQTTLLGYENQDYPFREVIKKVGAENEVSRNPVFDVMLIVQNFETRDFELEGLRLSPYRPAEEELHNTSKLDLTIEAAESPEGVHFNLEYCTRLFKRETVERFFRHFVNIIEEVVREPGIRLSSVNMIDDEERRRLLGDFNDTQPETVVDEKLVIHRIEDRVEKTPGGIAVAGRGNDGFSSPRRLFLTYRQLNEASGNLAGILTAKGAGPDVIIAIMVDSSVEMVIGLLGIAKSGGAYLPIEPGSPDDRISYMLADSGAAILITTPNLKEKVNKLQVEKIFIGETGNRSYEPYMSYNARPGNIAYVIYTSGTTGRPKGVLVEHRNLSAYIEAFENEFELSPVDTVIQQVSYAFDAFVEELYPILIKGGKLVVPGREVLRDIRGLCHIIALHAVTMITCSPQLLNELDQVVAGLPEKTVNPLASLRILISGGDQLKSEYIVNLRQVGDVYNTYGPTESTVCATYYRCTRSGDLPANVPIGTPIANYRVYILDKYANLSPIGVPGELCVAGSGVTRGYLNRPELTVEHFVSGGQGALLKNRPQNLGDAVRLSQFPTSICRKFPPKTFNNQKFCSNFFKSLAPGRAAGGKLYRTGDLACWQPGGAIEFLGRIDRQVKIRGYRIELAEIENQLTNLDYIKEAVVVENEKKSGQVFLTAYIVCERSAAAADKARHRTLENSQNPGEETRFSPDSSIDPAGIKSSLSRRLPDYMIPPYIMELAEIPLTTSGKVDRKKLPRPDVTVGSVYTAPVSEKENRLARIWKEVLEVERVGLDDNFFDLGGTSLDIFTVNNRIKEEFSKQIPVVSMFRYSTVRTLVRYLDAGAGEAGISREKQEQLSSASAKGKETIKRMIGKKARAKQGDEIEILDATADGKEMNKESIDNVSQETGKNVHSTGLEIAVIGMAGIFPGCRNVDEFWENLKNGVETIGRFSDEELLAEGIEAPALESPNYIKARGLLPGAEYFDNTFFGYTPMEAQVMDPQMRIFTQCIWHALEDAGYDPYSYSQRIGLYAGASPNLQWEAITAFSGAARGLSGFMVAQLADKDFMCTHISYKLNLGGPSLSIQTACSTSLVAIHMAAQGLLLGECEMALTGGISINYPPRRGYIYQEGMIFSDDGHNRTFDAGAKGSVFGDGAGVVLLKRLKEALNDRDNIYAVIKGSAINNDGLRKVGYTAPSIDGQAEVIKSAQLMAEVEPETVTYLEAHGTATPLGDTVEIEALNKAFNTGEKGFCAIGTVKSNMGHLYSAAGAAGFMKTVLMLKNRLIPPTLHFTVPNPRIDFANSPFYVVTRLTEWQPGPLRAGVSSFGIGGTNAHVILQEAPARVEGSRPEDSRNLKLLLLSAKGGRELNKISENLSDYLKKNPGIDFADVAYTLQTGRRHFPHRRMVVTPAPDLNKDAGKFAAAAKRSQVFTVREERRPVYFMICGQGSQYVNMGIDLYLREPVFRKETDRCFEILKSLMGYELKDVLYPGFSHPSAPNGATGGGQPGLDINRTDITQPIIFTFEYALAKLLMTWGIRPAAMIGYSFGEYVAACLSGVFSLQDALELVIFRGRLARKTPEGAMISVPLPEKELKPLLNENLSLAIVNGPTCIVSGLKEAVAEFDKEMRAKRVLCVPVNMSQAVHSPVMNSIREEFENKIKGFTLNKPRIPYISNVSARWITAEEAANPAYWGDHLSSTVRFSDGLKELLKDENAIFMEIGPGRILGMMVRVHPGKKPGHVILNTVKHPQEKISDDRFLLDKVGQLWLQGQEINWDGFYGKEKRCRVSLPGYPFTGKRYWIDAAALQGVDGMPQLDQVLQPSPEVEPAGVEASALGVTGTAAANYTAPRDEMEQAIARLWQEQMGIERIGIDDDFFYLNGSSLVATQIIVKLQQDYDVELPINLFYEEPTIAHLTSVIKELREKKEKKG